MTEAAWGEDGFLQTKEKGLERALTALGMNQPR